MGLSFVDDHGVPVTMATYLSGEKPTVLVMAYYNCPMLCNLVLNGVTKAAGGVNWNMGEEYQTVVVSIEPSETYELASAKKTTYLADLGRPGADAGWHFLTGDRSQSKALSDAVGFKYFWDEAQEQWAHPAVVVLLSPDGKITRYLYGIEFPASDFRLALLEASEGKVGSTLDKLILYCFHYDPAQGGYVLFAQNVMKLGGGLTLALMGIFMAIYWIKERKRRRKLALSFAEEAVS